MYKQDPKNYRKHGAKNQAINRKSLQECRKNGISKAILCSYSPSCDRRGITGKLLEENGIEVINVF